MEERHQAVDVAGYPVIAAANPLREVKSDADYVANMLEGDPGPIVLVGHAYGRVVITNAVNGNANVKALVYVAALAPDAGEAAAEPFGRSPAAAPLALAPVQLADGRREFFIDREEFREQFAADLPEADMQVMAATQRPIADIVFGEATRTPAWKTVPSWFVYGTDDAIVAPAAQTFMAQRAGAKATVAVTGASHVVMASRPEAVASVIENAAAAAAHRSQP